MPAQSLKEKLISKLKEIDDPAILEEVSNLFELQEPETVYQVIPQQQKAIDKAREQIKNKETLSDNEADKEIDEYWREHNHSNTYSIKLNLIIKKAITLIAAHPQIGRRTNVDNVRVKLVREYLIFYEERNKQIFILTIWDSRRNPENLPF